MKDKRSFKDYYIWAFVCLMVLLVFGVIGFNIYDNNKIVSYLSIDINPSVMLGVTKHDEVKEVNILNDDAKELVKDLNLKGEDSLVATNKIIDKAVELGYIDKNEEDNAVLVSTYCNNKEKSHKMRNRVNNSVNKHLNVKRIRVLIASEELTLEDAKKANQYGVSEAKILFVKRALRENPDLKFEDLIHLPSGEIAKYISDYDSFTGGKGNGAGYGNKNGNGIGQDTENGKGNGFSQGLGGGSGAHHRKRDGSFNGNCSGVNCHNKH